MRFPITLINYMRAYFQSFLRYNELFVEKLRFCAVFTHERGTAYHLTFEHLHHHSTPLRNI